MSQSAYSDLISRIHTHCQQVVQDARPGSGWKRKTKDFVRWYIPQRKTCLVLKPEESGQEPLFAFPPATEQQVWETEQQLGFPLPPLLRLLYTQIANGGFGPGFGIIGGKDGYPGIDHLPGNIVRRYQWEIDLADAFRQLDKGGWASLTPKNWQVFGEDGMGGELTDELRGEVWTIAEEDWSPPWPNQLLPLCEHGCNITTYLFADTEQVVQGMHNPYLVVATSLEEWLERWLAGEDLQLM